MRYVPRFILILLALITAFIGFTPARAVDATVTDCVNFIGTGTISQAVADANAGGGIITFACGGTIIFDNQLVISADVTINSNGNTVIFDEAGDNNRFFVVNGGASLTLNGFTLQNGNSSFGGAIYNNGTLTVTNSTFTDNSSTGVGGAIDNDGTLTVSNSTFTGNSATNGGAIMNFSSGTITISNNTFTTNSVSSSGGAIFAGISGTLTISDNTFTNNSATDGGAIFTDGSGTMTISNNTFTTNSATGFGGAIYQDSFSTLTINNNTFTSNSAQSGGAIANDGTIIINTSTFTGNLVNGAGGAIWNNATMTVNTSTLTGNSATSTGGIANGGGLSINTSILMNNSSSDFGAAIRNFGPGITSSQDSHYENNSCFDPTTITDNGGNTATNAIGCPGSAPIALDISALACVGDDAVFTINNGDANFDITGTGAGLDILDSPAGLITLTGPDTWTNITITERRGERESVNIGGIDCVTGEIIPPSEPVAPAPAVAVLGVCVGCVRWGRSRQHAR
ncbi:MAG: right-handed parallel beta-helix repeat-containing protein [Anaerolineae bacterium]|nr:right-handed parallel beta-helix repeat-containing protein [Anaerolineae bacterium]